jgi:deoxyribodipyrimidine photo-lyase
MATAIWWIRRDLRLHDNPALAEAAKSEFILPLFILDPRLLESEYASERRLGFMLAGLRKLDESLAARGSRLIVRRGLPEQVLPRLVQEVGADLIFAAADISPFGRARDRQIAARLPLQLLPGITIRPPDEIVKANGEPYLVFTPYRKAWRSADPPAVPLAAPEKLRMPDNITGESLPETPSYDQKLSFPAGEGAALARLKTFTYGSPATIDGYGDGRDRMAEDRTSRLSPYLRFGMLSPRTAARAAFDVIDASAGQDGSGPETWLSELIWREFYFSILYHFPHVRRRSFRPEYDAIRWRNDPSEYQAWTQGQTGYPAVDAGMRQLLATGWMHNRARMITASFLVKDLLIDWRWGERWFMQHLLDGDPASNNGGWQWTAGTGTDAAPYFRIFNPVLQSKRYDPDGEYIRRWVPELQPLTTKEIHEPWLMPAARQAALGVRIGKTYPAPIIDHSFARQRTLDAYRAAREQNSLARE